MSQLSHHDTGPSTGIIRRFSDHEALVSPADSLSRGLAVKVKHDREEEQRLISLRSDWQLLFQDVHQLVDSYVPIMVRPKS